MNNKLYIPLYCGNFTEENLQVYARLLKKCEADCVFLALDRESFFTGEKKFFDNVTRFVEYFESQGFECGVWMQAFGFGATEKNHLIPKGRYTKIRSVLGDELIDAFCPECENYMADYLAWIERVAKTGTKMIMIDDDLCLSVRPGLGCFCKNHMALYEKELGESLDGKNLTKLFFSGKPNKYRKVWLDVQKNVLLDFAKKVRGKIDEVNPSIRAGFCAGYTSWDIEGADSIEVTTALAGNTKPFLRFTGAPYWVTKNINRFPGQHLSLVNELARVQETWCRNTDIEIFAEADSYPRPRYNVASSYVECFDAAMVASGGMGDLKYLFEYYAHPDNETGYIKRHMKNKPLRDFLHTHFDGKKEDGVFVCERMKKVCDMTFPEEFLGEQKFMDSAHMYASAMLSPLGIPTVFENVGDIAIAFNNNVDMLKTLPKKLIIDIKAAEILKERGVDVGLEALSETSVPIFEHFGETRTPLFANAVSKYYDCKLNCNAKPLSFFENDSGFIPSAYRYDNGECEFLVFTFDAYATPLNSSLFVSYNRQSQLVDFIGNKFCYIKNEPGIYQICKRGDNETLLFFENLWEDSIFDFDISLDGKYLSALFFGVDGILEGDRIHVTNEVAPYGMFAVVLER